MYNKPAAILKIVFVIQKEITTNHSQCIKAQKTQVFYTDTFHCKHCVLGEWMEQAVHPMWYLRGTKTYIMVRQVRTQLTIKSYIRLT